MTGTIVDDMFDMSVVTDASVAAALPKLLIQWRNKKQWSEIAIETREAHLAILGSFLKLAAPPPATEITSDVLADLVHRDLVVAKDGVITAAYPFSALPTRHCVEIDDVAIAAVCAIDALGTAAMVGKAARVTSRCPTCEDEISVDVHKDGLTVRSQSHHEPRVWAGIVPIAGCAADSQCQSMLMFCCPEHLEDWRASAAMPPDGFAFTLTQAIQTGAAIFKPFLVT